MKAKYEVRAKVRIGKKVGGRPASVDYFISDDPELAALFGDEPKAIRIRFPHASVDDSFSTGLEWWSKRKRDGQNQLACYTKDSSDAPVALRMEAYGTDGFDIGGDYGSPVSSDYVVPFVFTGTLDQVTIDLL